MAERIFPSHDLLTRFFRERHPRTLAEVAELAGWPAARLRRQAASEDVLVRGSLVPWSAAARWVMDSWPLATLLPILAAETDVLPAALRPIPMPLLQPAYLVHALHVQSRIERMPHRIARPSTFDDYMTDLLHRAIDAGTVDALHGDEAFLHAYEFPDGGRDD
jgi:hypothetical protein